MHPLYILRTASGSTDCCGIFGITWLSLWIGFVTESTVIATIHCLDVGYYLFGISLVMHIPYHVPCTFPIVIVFYWVVLSIVRLFTSLAPCTQLGYSTLSTMYYWISTPVAIPCLFDSISCFVGYILSPRYLCFRTWLFRYQCSFAFWYFGTGYLVMC